ncbi:MAG: Holliday junction branch migration protein RuvA [Rhodobacter sp.]|nr:Holliday junction branch migration protein RuvA [Rhodobacter sp.]
MIGRLAGRLDYRGPDHVMVDVDGVGYVVSVSERTLAALPGPGKSVVLYTDLLVREDLLQLFGFVSPIEREWHRLLMTVQGVGAKASVAILGTLGAEGISRAISIGDWAAVRAAPGVGPRIAQRVVNELKDKAPSLMALGGAIASHDGPPVETANGTDEVLEAASSQRDGNAVAQSEALSALSNLGYGPSEAARAVAEASGAEPGVGTEELIRSALRLLAPKG